jgi:hypothetical protein
MIPTMAQVGQEELEDGDVTATGAVAGDVWELGDAALSVTSSSNE